MNKLLFSGELPPSSVNGVAYSNETNLNILESIFDVYLVHESVSISDHKSFTLNKILSSINVLIDIFKLNLIHRFDFFYLTFPTSIFGNLKILFQLIIFKIFNQKSQICIHLHRGDIISHINKNIVSQILFLLTLKFCNIFIVLSEKDKVYLINNYTNYNCSIKVLSNTIKYDVEKYFSQLNKNSINKFIFISNYIEEKGILDLLDVFNNLNLDVSLECFGNFTDSKLRDKILSYKSHNIHIFGPIYDEDKLDKISKSDCLILPSHNEGMPLILLESMAVGTPFITTSVGCINEMVYEDYPFIYNSKNKSELYNLVHRFVSQDIRNNKQLRLRLKNHYSKNFSLKSHEEALKNIFVNEN